MCCGPVYLWRHDEMLASGHVCYVIPNGKTPCLNVACELMNTDLCANPFVLLYVAHALFLVLIRTYDSLLSCY